MRKPVKRKRSEESSHQKAFFKWLTLWNKRVRDVTFHIPNGGKRDILEAKSLKAQGVLSGVPDIFCAISTLKHSGLFIEMKSKSGKVTYLQNAMHKRLTDNGYYVSVCYSWFEARNCILNYLQYGIKNV